MLKGYLYLLQEIMIPLFLPAAHSLSPPIFVPVHVNIDLSSNRHRPILKPLEANVTVFSELVMIPVDDFPINSWQNKSAPFWLSQKK